MKKRRNVRVTRGCVYLYTRCALTLMLVYKECIRIGKFCSNLKIYALDRDN